MRTNVKHVLISLWGHQHSLNHGGKTISWWRNIFRSNCACDKLSEAFLRSFKPLSDVPAASSLRLWVYVFVVVTAQQSVSHIWHLSPAPSALSETQRTSQEEKEVRTNFIVPARKQATTVLHLEIKYNRKHIKDSALCIIYKIHSIISILRKRYCQYGHHKTVKSRLRTTCFWTYNIMISKTFETSSWFQWLDWWVTSVRSKHLALVQSLKTQKTHSSNNIRKV